MAVSSSSTRRPLTSRPLDMLYLVFFTIHIPATVLLDTQPLLQLKLLEPLGKFYFDLSSDPLLGGVSGLNGPPALWTWFQSYLVLELVFQLPIFFLGIQGLYKDSRMIYPLLLIYAASTSTTLLPCLATVLTTPVSPVPELTSIVLEQAKMLSITPEQRMLLIASYVPFLIIPMVMAVDMAGRIGELMIKGMDAEEREKVE